MKQNGLALQHASKNLQDDNDIVLEATKHKDFPQHAAEGGAINRF